ncbi:MAG: aldo/keto reductase [Cyanobacteria bacterium P01_D01_bin.36]
MKTFTLNDGNVIPAFGLGTWKSPKDAVYEAVKAALKTGYTHIDAAWIYGNEDEVGKGLSESMAEGAIVRDNLFVTSKLWNSFHAPEDVEKGCKETLSALKLDYLDLYLMHWPIGINPGSGRPDYKRASPEYFVPLSECPFSATFEAMMALKEKGLVKSVGVSNFGVSKLEKLIEETGVVPVMNQVELHPYNPQPELKAYCEAKGIQLTAYSPLGSGDRPESMKAKDEPPLLENEVVKQAAVAEGISMAQLLIAWALDRGTVVIPKSTNAGRIEENFAAASHTLSADARKALDEIDIAFRYVSPEAWFIPGVTYEGESFWS